MGRAINLHEDKMGIGDGRLGTAAELCMECHLACVETMHHCLVAGGELAAAEHIGILRDCAEICLTNAHFLLSGSYFHTRTSSICADACDTCAIECAQSEDDHRLHACAEIARRCADACRRLAAQFAA